ncbi:piggyBac transposable element-derived protein 4 isoform X1 [Bombyx mori]|uniref:PiggyBac transposable element-derived protein domain-containing protein n=2 Tax=Bombyx mori TaxID=7091 RepID=A0A8R2LU44_BOMMO|nr:piggyBac transposable element-derived protein 4-like isoform X1 [Bombyx mori]XP_037866464.1 piggyBac transposable element-derived protein 4-like isoform X1 [Bombyx mori]XP_037866465.1 piggyBac transposable element-derived protein 4-like isoform X1 [Bombyx mori]XP_037867024.1 piggyBac transposable element-derived protein 4-like isoform X1 [Bombyx mori]XP_037867025.1 piggyBac transposable element-derived protein 4-like isoform X1 [Bombyx mori]
MRPRRGLGAARGRGAARGGGQRGVRGGRGGRRPRCARSLPFSHLGDENVEVETSPGPSGIPQRPSLTEQLKVAKVARLLDKKHENLLSADQKKELARLRDGKQVGNFKMPDAPEPQRGRGKGKGKGKGRGSEDSRMWRPCPLLPGVPTVPPPRVRQSWELQQQRPIDITAEQEGEDDDIESYFLPDITEDEEMRPPLLEDEEAVPSAGTPPQAKKRKIQFSPSMGIIQATALPQNIVPAEIELLGFTPSSTGTRTALDSGRSNYSMDIDIDMERDFIEPGEGSEVDEGDSANMVGMIDNSLKPRRIDDFPMDLDSIAEHEVVEVIQELDNAADEVLRNVVGPETDLLHFDWRGEPENFESVREAFTVPSTGPTFDNADLIPLDVFFKIWDADIIAYIVRETNRYGAQLIRSTIPSKPNSRLSRWKDVTSDEILRFLAVLMLQSLVIDYVEREYWYAVIEELQIGNFKEIMTYNRFIVIKRCLHFIDNATLPVPPTKLDKIIPIIEHLNKKFKSLYVLEQNIAIDESLLLWKGRLSFAQKIATKRARVGIKSYELCESRTGYLWQMEVYTGKGHAHVVQDGEPEERGQESDEPESATAQIVLNLTRPLFDKGHTLIMDNFYNAPLLSRILKVQHKTDSMGTLRLNREFVPEALKKKTKKNMKEGEVAFSTTKDLSVVVWMDKNIVAMISSFHPIEVGGIEKYGYYRYKPQVVLDYNFSMGGIDHKDQMLSAYPIERSRNIIWYKKLFRRLLNVSMHNALVMFNHNRTHALRHREFRLQLAKQLLQSSRSAAPSRSLAPAARPEPAACIRDMHLPGKNTKKQRCKLCYSAKVQRSTVWRCTTCNVNLCIVGCYTVYHINLAQTPAV